MRPQSSHPAAPAKTAERPALRKDPVFWFSLALVFLAGAVFNFLPVTFPIFKRVFGASLEQMGRLQLVFYLSWLLLSLTGGWLIGRIGLKYAAAATLAVFAFALLLIAGTPVFAFVVAGAFLLGLAVASNSVISSSIISNHFGDRRQSVFFLSGILDSAGSMLGPAALGWWLGQATVGGRDWRFGYVGGAAVMGLLLAWAMLMRPEALDRGKAAASGPAAARSEMLEILRGPVIYGVGLLGFLHGVAQGGAISFAGQLYEARLHIRASEAAYMLSINAAGFFAGRSLLAWATARWRIPELLLLAVCSGLGTLAYVALIVSPSYFLGLGAFALAGVLISGNGPSINSYIGFRFAERTASAFALFVGLSCFGSAGGAYLIGFVGSAIGVDNGIWIVPIASAALSLFSMAWFLRRSGRRPV